MDIPKQFLAYAAAFEETFEDDQWERLRVHFHDDATYEVRAQAFPCRLTGPDAIFAGIKKSLDGFDRVFDTREIGLVGGPEVEGDELRVSWTVTYRKQDFEPFVLRGRSIATFRDGKLAALVDAYEPDAEQELADWSRSSGIRVDPSYT